MRGKTENKSYMRKTFSSRMKSINKDKINIHKSPSAVQNP